MTLEQRLQAEGGKGPGFHFIRHALSVVILLHHASVLAVGAEVSPAATKGDAVASLAALMAGTGGLRQAVIELLRPFLFSLVAAFFVLSGFLVAGSALRTRNVRQFLAFRVLRIVPALSSEVVLSAFVLGPLVTSFTLSAYFSDPSFFGYFGNIFGFVHYHLPGAFLGNPMPALVNANLWTLPPEFYCYLIMTGLMLSGLVYRPKIFLRLVVAASLVALLLGATGWVGVTTRQDTTRFSSWLIVYLFVVGVALFAYARHVPLSRGLFLFCGAAYFLLMVLKSDDVLAALFLSYCVVYVGMTPFPRFDRVVKVDLSYGIYLYGYPITQGLAYFLGPELALHGPAARRAMIMGLALPLTAIFAYASWIWVEKPALSLKRFLVAKRAKPPTAEPFAAPAE